MSKNIGLDRILYFLEAESPAGYIAGMHIRFAGPLVQYQTYNQKWIDHYTENGYALRDPMVAWGFTKDGASRWSEIDLPDPFVNGRVKVSQRAAQNVATLGWV